MPHCGPDPCDSNQYYAALAQLQAGLGDLGVELICHHDLGAYIDLFAYAFVTPDARSPNEWKFIAKRRPLAVPDSPILLRKPDQN